MKFVYNGRNRVIGSKVVSKLTAAGHEAIAASPSNGMIALPGRALMRRWRGRNAVL